MDRKISRMAKSRRNEHWRIRFSLKLLLLLFFFSGTFFGYIAHLRINAQRYFAAVELLGEEGAFVTYNYQHDEVNHALIDKPSLPRWGRFAEWIGADTLGGTRLYTDFPEPTREALLPAKDLQNLVYVLIDPGYLLSDDDLEIFENATKLEHLSISWLNIDGQGEGLVSLQHLPNLKYLGLERSNVSDSSVKQLAKITSLERLDLSYSDVTDSGIQVFLDHPKLEFVNVAETDVTNEGADMLRRAGTEVWTDFPRGEEPTGVGSPFR